MVELAIVLPILLGLLFAVAEFSLMFLNYQTVASAAREGARSASLFRPNCAANVTGEVNQVVSTVLTSSGLPATVPQINGACAVPGLSSVTVTVNYDFQFVPGFITNLGLNRLALTATSVMQNES